MFAFEVRDGTASMLEDGGWDMSATAYALLWVLLYHGIYDRNSKWFGHVNIQITSQEVLAKLVGRNRSSVVRGLAELEANGFIKRTKRFAPRGQRLNDDIALETPSDFCFSCRARGHQEADCTMLQNTT